MDPEKLKKEEKRISDQNPPLHEPTTASLPESDIPDPGEGAWGLADDAEGEPVIDAPIEPEPEIDQVDVSREPEARLPGKNPQVPIVDPEGETGITPEPDRSPGAPSDSH